MVNPSCHGELFMLVRQFLLLPTGAQKMEQKSGARQPKNRRDFLAAHKKQVLSF
jgi:hypothetical protein